MTIHGDDQASQGDVRLPRSLQIAGALSWRIVALAAAGWVIGQVVAATGVVLVPIAISLLLCSVVRPLAVLLRHRLHLNRYLAAGLVVVVLLAVVGGLVTLAGTTIAGGIAPLQAAVLAGVSRLEHLIGNDQLGRLLGAAREWAVANEGRLASGVLQAGGSATELAAGVLLVLVSLFFFMADGEHIWRWFTDLVPRPQRAQTREVAGLVWTALGAYSRTQVVVATVDAAGISLGALLLGLPLIPALFVIVFFCAFIPIVGVFAAGTASVLIALAVRGPVVALVMLAVVIVVQQIEAHVMAPVLMGRAVEIHPWAVIVGVAIGSFLWGVVGAFFAVPLLATLHTIQRYVRDPHQRNGAESPSDVIDGDVTGPDSTRAGEGAPVDAGR